MSSASRRIGNLVVMIQDRFLETPGLTLTPRQVQQQFGVDEITCYSILNMLVEGCVLTVTAEGRYARLSPRPVVAAILSYPGRA